MLIVQANKIHTVKEDQTIRCVVNIDCLYLDSSFGKICQFLPENRLIVGF